MYALFFVLTALISLGTLTISREGAPSGLRNEAVVTEGSVTLRCGKDTKCQMHWRHRNLNGTEVDLPNNYMSFNTSSDGKHDLHVHIFNVSRPHAGTYICLTKLEGRAKDCSDDDMWKRFEAHLVLIQYPKYKTNISHSNYTVAENQDLKMSCSLAYFGAVIPEVKWKRDNETIQENVTTEIIGSRSIKSSLSLKATMDLNNSRISCVTSFVSVNNTSSDDKSVVRATNVPEYVMTFPPLNVQWLGKIELMPDTALARRGFRMPNIVVLPRQLPGNNDHMGSHGTGGNGNNDFPTWAIVLIVIFGALVMCCCGSIACRKIRK